MRRALCLCTALVAASLSVGCTVTTSTSPTNTATPTNTAKPAAATNTAPTNTAATNTATPAGASTDLSNLAIHNKTKWSVHHLYLSPAKENEWGPDQLGSNQIDPGQTFTLKDIPCNTYDIKVVDEDGDECVIKGEKFCGHEASWDLSDDELLGCEGYGDE
jgi:hypothetical protein